MANQVASVSVTVTLVSHQILDKDLKASIANSGNKDAANGSRQSGRRKRAVVRASKVCFDEADATYHSEVKELADGA